MHLTGIHIAYLHTCQRKLWLFSKHVQMEHSSGLVAEGRLVEEYSYLRRSDKYTQIALGGIKIDYYDAKKKIIHEVKKSSKMEHVHIAQVKYYLYQLEQVGVSGAKGLLEYPKEKKKTEVSLQESDRASIHEWEAEVERITALETCPALLHAPLCQRCSYHDFCYSAE